MTKKYEVAIKILDDAKADDLILLLVHQGYAVYYNDLDNVVCFTAEDGEVTEIKV